LSKHIALAFSGASGAPYFQRLVERLGEREDVTLHLVISEGGKRVLAAEADQDWREVIQERFEVHTNKNIGASIASGSFRLDALVVVPCSMNTLAAIAYGLAGNLIQRAAAVQLKERRKVILVPRETPLSLLNLRAMTTACEAGALILPAMPSYYHNPKTVTDLVDTVVDRVIDHLDLEDPTVKRWNPK
jgi:4-hydroxy-3-polyprenylbenzoate decarboxylase